MNGIKNLMRDSVIMMALMSLLCMCSNAKNDSKFEDKVMELMKATGQNEQFQGLNYSMKELLQKVNREVLDASDIERGDELADKYIAENMEDKMLKPLLVGMFEGKVTAEELDEVIKQLNTPEGKQYTEHLKDMRLSIDATTMGLMENADGTQKVELTCPEEYGKKFLVFYEKSQVKSFMERLEKLLTTTATMSGNESDKKQAEDMIKFLRENMPTAMANCAYGKLTEADLEFGIKLNEMPAYSKFTKSLDFQELITNSMQKCLDFSNDYKDWLKKQI